MDPNGQKPLPSPKKTFRRKKQLEKDIAHITEEMYRHNKELADTNRTLSLLQAIDSLVLQSQAPLEEVIKQITEAITKLTDYPFVAVLTHRGSAGNELGVLGWSVRDMEVSEDVVHHLSTLKVSSSLPWLMQDEKQILVHANHVTNHQLSHLFQMPEKMVESARQLSPFKSFYLVKLSARQQLVGVMAIGLVSPSAQLTTTETLFIDRLSEAVGVAVDNKLLFEENQRIVRQLKNSNEKLKALDETKDEFISMASHQLRTPLTSVKGYVSMVLEGDAGKVNDMQKKLLDQAFLSSQRMVYLIADLLNVSRMRTGKFMIERKPTQLADVIASEIAQLTETAKGRGLELTYTKPKDFPMLMLDDTKIRQVIMNFADNAIYYTQSGANRGYIQITLEDKGTSVEFTVADDGIGVPKESQHHLFTKFYRAGNAQHARPDGTGLGLFMAKKVIVAQGGAIIFHSEEGKGSTFGFSFPKAQVKVPDHIKPAAPKKSLAKKA